MCIGFDKLISSLVFLCVHDFDILLHGRTAMIALYLIAIKDKQGFDTGDPLVI